MSDKELLLYTTKLSTVPLVLQVNFMQDKVLISLTSTPSSLNNLSKVNLLDLSMNSSSPIPAGPDKTSENLNKFLSIQSRYVPSYISILLMYFIIRLYKSKMLGKYILLNTAKLSTVPLPVLQTNVMQERVVDNLTSTHSSLNNFFNLNPFDLSLNSLSSLSPFPGGPDQTCENLRKFLSIQSRYVLSYISILLMYFYYQT